MKTLFIWIFSILLTGIFISPFFLFKLLKRRSIWLYIAVNSAIVLILFLWFFYSGYDLISDYFAKMDADLYYYFYNITDNFLIIMPFLFIISPFIFIKIVYNKITLKRFFISLLFFALNVAILILIVAYYILPKAGEMLLNNI